MHVFLIMYCLVHRSVNISFPIFPEWVARLVRLLCPDKCGNFPARLLASFRWPFFLNQNMGWQKPWLLIETDSDVSNHSVFFKHLFKSSIFLDSTHLDEKIRFSVEEHHELWGFQDYMEINAKLKLPGKEDAEVPKLRWDLWRSTVEFLRFNLFSPYPSPMASEGLITSAIVRVLILEARRFLTALLALNNHDTSCGVCEVGIDVGEFQVQVLGASDKNLPTVFAKKIATKSTSRILGICQHKKNGPWHQVNTHQVGHGEEFDLLAAEITDLFGGPNQNHIVGRRKKLGHFPWQKSLFQMSSFQKMANLFEGDEWWSTKNIKKRRKPTNSEIPTAPDSEMVLRFAQRNMALLTEIQCPGLIPTIAEPNSSGSSDDLANRKVVSPQLKSGWRSMSYL